MKSTASSLPGELRDIGVSEHVRMLDSSTRFHGHIFDVMVDDVELVSTSGRMTREYIRHDDAVAVLAVRDGEAGEEVLLIRQYRHPVRHLMWEIPAGLLDIEGEDPKVAAARELAEEAELGAHELTFLASFFTSPGCSDEKLDVFLARDVHPVETEFSREDEEAEIETAWVALDAVVAGVLAGHLHCPSLVVGVLAYTASRR
ncbi:NUDIX hydrolase [Actinomycetaceae bacterium L2_0104]